jgi:hypothetical protein
MSAFADLILIDPAELRDASSTLRSAASDLADLGARVPADLPEAPWWVVEQVGDELWRIRAECTELCDELAIAARELDARAAEVETSDARTYEITDGRLRCLCRLTDGTIVTVGGDSLISQNAIGSLVPVTIGASAVGEAAWGSGVAGGMITIGGGGLPGSAVGDAAWGGGSILVGGVPLPDYSSGSGGNQVLIGGVGLPDSGSIGGNQVLIGGTVDVTIPNIHTSVDDIYGLLNMRPTGNYDPAMGAANTMLTNSLLHSSTIAYDNMQASMSPTYVDSSNFATYSDYASYNNIHDY